MGKYKNKIGIEFEGFDEAINRLTKLGANVQEITERGLKESHKMITEKAEEAVQKANLPAKGKYSRGATESALKREAKVEWAGTLGSVPVGFSIREGGLASIFMIYGTPRYMKNQKMYNAFWSAKTRNEVLEAQEKIFYEEIRRLNG